MTKEYSNPADVTEEITAGELIDRMGISNHAFYKLKWTGKIPDPTRGEGVAKKYAPAMARKIIEQYGKGGK